MLERAIKRLVCNRLLTVGYTQEQLDRLLPVPKTTWLQWLLDHGAQLGNLVITILQIIALIEMPHGPANATE